MFDVCGSYIDVLKKGASKIFLTVLLLNMIYNGTHVPMSTVRDAVARLPNGEGTRGDICELLKDSQFLAPGITDAQVGVLARSS